MEARRPGCSRTKVATTDIDVERGEATASQVLENGGDGIFTAQDVTNEQRWLEVKADTVSRCGRPNALAHNTGVGARCTIEEPNVADRQGQMLVHRRASAWEQGTPSRKLESWAAAPSSTYPSSARRWAPHHHRLPCRQPVHQFCRHAVCRRENPGKLGAFKVAAGHRRPTPVYSLDEKRQACQGRGFRNRPRRL